MLLHPVESGSERSPIHMYVCMYVSMHIPRKERWNYSMNKFEDKEFDVTLGTRGHGRRPVTDDENGNATWEST